MSNSKYDYPPISDEEVTHLMRDIVILVSDDHGIYYVLDVKQAHPSKQSFLWNATKTVPWVQPSDVALLTEIPIRMYHTYGAPICFKPSLAEVIGQIPRALRPDIRAFHFSYPEISGMDKDALNNGYHSSDVLLFGIRDTETQEQLVDQRETHGHRRSPKYTAP